MKKYKYEKQNKENFNACKVCGVDYSKTKNPNDSFLVGGICSSCRAKIIAENNKSYQKVIEERLKLKNEEKKGNK